MNSAVDLGTFRFQSVTTPRQFDRVIVRYELAVVSVAVSLLVALSLKDHTFRTPLFFPAIILCSWFGGAGPGLLAVLLSTLSINFFILEPTFSFSFRDVVQLAVFLFSALLISSWGSARRRAEYALERARTELEDKVKERGADLTQSNEQFRNLVNTIGGIVWQADADTFQFTFVSEQAERILGYPVEDWLSNPTFWSDHLHPEDREWAVKFCLNTTAEKRDHDFEYRMIAADGRAVWLRDLVTVVVENDRVTNLRGVMVDVTEGKLAEERLIKTEERLRNVVGNAPVILFALDRSGVVTLSEGRGLDAFGVKPGQLVGRSIFDLGHDSPGLHKNARRALTGEAVNFVTEWNNQFFEIHLIPLLNKNGEVAGLTGVTYNITDRQRTEKELRLVIDVMTSKKKAAKPRKSVKKAKTRKVPKAQGAKTTRIGVLIADDHSGAAVSGETLSAREIDVLKLMAQGKSNKEIGSALFISESTLKSRVKGIFAKMNVISRTEAVANATRRGLIQL